MRVERRVHRREGVESAGGGPTEISYVRWHVVDDAGQCIPEACVGVGRLCGYARQYQARNAAIKLRDEMRSLAGRRDGR